MIVLDRVSKRYKSHGSGHSKLVLDELSAVFEPGKTVGILGRRGAGKSTLIRLIAGSVPRIPAGCCARAGCRSWSAPPAPSSAP